MVDGKISVQLQIMKKIIKILWKNYHNVANFPQLSNSR